MASHLNQSQIQMLVKKRANLNDHQLFEMIRSRQVFQVQNELRKGLERAKKALQHDEKTVLAGLRCEKVMFLKKVYARKRKMRYLVQVKISLDDAAGAFDDDGAEPEVTDLSKSSPEGVTTVDTFNKKCALTPHGNEARATNALGLPLPLPSIEMDGRSLNHRSRARSNHNDKIVATPNDVWMKIVNERNKRKSVNSKQFRYKGDMQTKESTKDDLSDFLPMRLDEDADILKIRSKSRSRSRARSNLDSYHMHAVQRSRSESFQSVRYANTKKREDSINNDNDISIQRRGVSGYSLRLRSSSVNENRSYRPRAPNQNFPTLSLHEHNSINSKPNQIIGNEHNKATEHNVEDLIPERTVREKTITMLFVDREDGGKSPTVSAFDIEACLKQNRRRRGHSITVSSTYFPEFEHNQYPSLTNKSRYRSKVGRKSVRNLRTPVQEKPPLHFRSTSDRQNIRQRGSDWFTKYLDEKNRDSHSRRIPKEARSLKLKPMEDLHAHDHHAAKLGEHKLRLPAISHASDDI